VTLSNFTEKMTSVRMIKKFEEQKAQEKERKRLEQIKREKLREIGKKNYESYR